MVHRWLQKAVGGYFAVIWRKRTIPTGSLYNFHPKLRAKRGVSDWFPCPVRKVIIYAFILWLTDPTYDRMNRHSRNDFDNTRYNIMVGLMNELDPAWVERNFDKLKISGKSGSEAARSVFYDKGNFTKFLHENIVNKGFIAGSEGMKNQDWYSKDYAFGQKGLVEEILKMQKSPEYSDRERLKSEYDNLNLLYGNDKQFENKFQNLTQYMGCLSIANKDLDGVVNDNSFTGIKKASAGIREDAIEELRRYVSDPKNRALPDFKKAVAAFSVIDPVGAHNFVSGMRQEKKVDKKLVEGLNLVGLESQLGMDLGGRKAHKENAGRVRREPVMNNGNAQKKDAPVLSNSEKRLSI